MDSLIISSQQYCISENEIKLKIKKNGKSRTIPTKNIKTYHWLEGIPWVDSHEAHDLKLRHYVGSLNTQTSSRG